MADQNITALPVATTPESSDQILLVGATEEKLIDYDKLADAILNKLTSKNFGLDQGTKTLLQALNELNSKTSVLLPRTMDNAQPDTLPNGLVLTRYTRSTENRPSDYGVTMYITYKDGSNLWCTAIACGTNNVTYISSKTNTDKWSKWTPIVGV